MLFYTVKITCNYAQLNFAKPRLTKQCWSRYKFSLCNAAVIIKQNYVLNCSKISENLNSPKSFSHILFVDKTNEPKTWICSNNQDHVCDGERYCQKQLLIIFVGVFYSVHRRPSCQAVLNMLGFRCSHKEECQESIQIFECILVSNLILGSYLILVSNPFVEKRLSIEFFPKCWDNFWQILPKFSVQLRFGHRLHCLNYLIVNLEILQKSNLTVA